jgi:Leucine-rich repeat (LRR) protein
MKIILSSIRHHYVARVSIFLVMVALIAGMVGCGPSAVTFADPNLEAAVREAIAIPEGPIYPSDLEGLTSFSAFGRNITDLTGLEYWTSLTYLDLVDNQISDISPLANLTSLTELYLYWNQISDISPLANLTSLTVLGFDDNQISDISSLANLTNLDNLYVGGNQISDISALANLTSLTHLALYNNQISDISPLVDNEGLSEGDEVDLRNNPLSSDSINIDIPQLEARGVIVYY